MAQRPEAGEEGGEGGEQVEAVFLGSQRGCGAGMGDSGQGACRGMDARALGMGMKLRPRWGGARGEAAEALGGLSMNNAGVELKKGASRTDIEDEGRKGRG